MEIAQWREELDTYRTMKKMFILEGNIADLQPVGENGGSVDLMELEEFLHIYLTAKGYHCVVFYNRIDGFYNLFDRDDIMVNTFLSQAGSGSARCADLQKSAGAIRSAMRKTEHSVAVIIQMAGQLVGNAENLSAQEIEYLSTLHLSAREASTASADNARGWINNLLFLVTNKVQELPAWFYRYDPGCKVLTLEYPRERMREHIISSHQSSLLDWHSVDPKIRKKMVHQLVGRTDGFTCVELDSILDMCHGCTLNEVDERVRAYRHGRRENPWGELDEEKLCNLGQELSESVIGQPRAVAAVADVVVRAATGLSGLQHSSGNRPRGVLLFAGPTGTGKTELAKALARTVFGTESAMIRFDMSEYSQPHSDQRLLGAPPGYVGYDAGGELTNAVRAHPFSILLFDEIEKASPSILDKFLQILDDGRMTDSKGETVYFSECIIIFTSNIGLVRTMPDGSRTMLLTPQASLQEIEETITGELRRSWRPEFLNRIGNNIIVFDFIHEQQAKLIMDKQLRQICESLMEQRQLELVISEDSPFYQQMLERCQGNLEFGGRGIGNVVEHDFITPLSRILSQRKWSGGSTIVLDGLIDLDGQTALNYQIQNK